MRGGKPGQRFGGRAKGVQNRITKIEANAKAMAAGLPPAREYDSLVELRKVADLLMSMATEAQDTKMKAMLLEAAGRMLERILPYEHRRLASAAPAMETVVNKDGTVRVTISQDDAEL